MVSSSRIFLDNAIKWTDMTTHVEIKYRLHDREITEKVPIATGQTKRVDLWTLVKDLPTGTVYRNTADTTLSRLIKNIVTGKPVMGLREGIVNDGEEAEITPVSGLRKYKIRRIPRD